MKRPSRLASHSMPARLGMLAPLGVLALFGVLTGLVVPPAGAQRQEVEPPPGWPELPSGEVEVTVLEPTTASHFVELTAKLQAGLEDKQEWLAGYRRNSRAGQPLAWHPNLGLTRREYAQYLDLAGEIHLQPVGKATVEIRRKGNRIIFDAARPLAAVEELTLDLAQGKATTPFGDCTSFVPVRADARTQATAPWKGVTCQATDGATGQTVRSLVVSLGRFEESEAVFLSYEGRKTEHGRLSDRAAVYLSIP